MQRRWLVGTKRDRTSSGTFSRNASQQIRADSCPSPCEQTTSATFAAGSVSVSVMASAHPPLGQLRPRPFTLAEGRVCVNSGDLITFPRSPHVRTTRPGARNPGSLEVSRNRQFDTTGAGRAGESKREETARLLGTLSAPRAVELLLCADEEPGVRIWAVRGVTGKATPDKAATAPAGRRKS